MRLQESSGESHANHRDGSRRSAAAALAPVAEATEAGLVGDGTELEGRTQAVFNLLLTAAPVSAIVD